MIKDNLNNRKTKMSTNGDIVLNVFEQYFKTGHHMKYNEHISTQKELKEDNIPLQDFLLFKYSLHYHDLYNLVNLK